MVLIVYQLNTNRNAKILMIQIFVITIILKKGSVCGMVRIASYFNPVKISGVTKHKLVHKKAVILIHSLIHAEI